MAGKSSEQWQALLDGTLEGLEDMRNLFRSLLAVNTAARLGSVAGAGELLISMASAARADIDTAGLEHRALELKGREEPIEVVVLGVRAAVAA